MIVKIKILAFRKDCREESDMSPEPPHNRGMKDEDLSEEPKNEQH